MVLLRFFIVLFSYHAKRLEYINSILHNFLYYYVTYMLLLCHVYNYTTVKQDDEICK